MQSCAAGMPAAAAPQRVTHAAQQQASEKAADAKLAPGGAHAGAPRVRPLLSRPTERPEVVARNPSLPATCLTSSSPACKSLMVVASTHTRFWEGAGRRALCLRAQLAPNITSGHA